MISPLYTLSHRAGNGGFWSKSEGFGGFHHFCAIVTNYYPHYHRLASLCDTLLKMAYDSLEVAMNRPNRITTNYDNCYGPTLTDRQYNGCVIEPLVHKQAANDSMSEVEEFFSRPKYVIRDKQKTRELATRVYEANGITEKARNAVKLYEENIERNAGKGQVQPK